MDVAQLIRAYEPLPEPVLLLRPEGVILAVNAAAADLAGVQREALRDRHISSLLEGEPGRLERYLRMCAGCRQVLPGAFTWRGVDGRSFAVRCDCALMAPPGGDSGSVMMMRCREKSEVSTRFLALNDQIAALTREIRERRRAQAELYTQREWYRVTLSSIGDAVIATDGRGRVTFMNPVAEALTGWHESDAQGRLLREVFRIVNEVTRETVENPVDKVLQTGAIVGMVNHTVLISRDGTEYPIKDSAAPIRDRHNCILGVVLVFHDVSHLREAEKELSRYHDHLEEVVRERTAQLEASQALLFRAERLASIGTLTAGMAHEINNPLNAILVTAQCALEMFPNISDAEKREFYSTIVGEAQRCGRIVRSMLRFARQEQSHKWPSDLNEIVRRAAAVSRSYHRESALQRLEVLPGDGCPQVFVNPTEIEQVIVNLVKNAVEACDGQCEVVVTTEPAPGGARLIVRDNGPGIAEQDLVHIFDPFYTTKRTQGGTGLGLSVVHGIISSHGGQLDVGSKPGQGTEFVIFLPAATTGET